MHSPEKFREISRRAESILISVGVNSHWVFKWGCSQSSRHRQTLIKHFYETPLMTQSESLTKLPKTFLFLFYCLCSHLFISLLPLSFLQYHCYLLRCLRCYFLGELVIVAIFFTFSHWSQYRKTKLVLIKTLAQPAITTNAT